MDASLRELNVRTSELARRAQAGELITITDRGRPIAELGPHRARRRFAKKVDVARTFAGLEHIDLAALRGELDQIAAHDFDDPYSS
jgi:prevent-host-death family protein